LAKEFPNWLENALLRNKYNKRIVLIIDGFNKLDTREGAHDLIWFPHTFPKKVKKLLSGFLEIPLTTVFMKIRLVLSTTSHFTLEVLKKRKCETAELAPLEEAERKSFIRTYLSKKGSKRLNDDQEFKIAQAAQTSNPRFLQTLLDDISEFGHFDALDAKIDRDLGAANTAELFEIVLERLENDYDSKDLGVVRHFMSLLWASRRGAN